VNTILYDTRPDHTATLCLNRPRALNALTWEAMDEFSATLNQVAADSSVRALVIHGAGKAFCSGGDLFELHGFPTRADGERLAQVMGDALAQLESLPIPTIAAIEGPALGGGAELALACDMRIMAEGASLGMMHIKLGISPAWGGGQRLLRLVGYPKAMEWLSTGIVHNAVQAASHGLANHVTAQGGALPHALDLASRIAQASPQAVAAVKVALRAGVTMAVDAATQVEGKLFPELWASKPHLEASARFVARKARRPSPNGAKP
jgi:enoyl-CoA hydratase/carnithine racemase